MFRNINGLSALPVSGPFCLVPHRWQPTRQRRPQAREMALHTRRDKAIVKQRVYQALCGCIALAIIPTPLIADSLHRAFKGVAGADYRLFITAVPVMPVSLQELFQRPLKAGVMQERYGRLYRFGMQILRIHPYNSTSLILIAYGMFLKPLVQFSDSAIYPLPIPNVPCRHKAQIHKFESDLHQAHYLIKI